MWNKCDQNIEKNKMWPGGISSDIEMNFNEYLSTMNTRLQQYHEITYL